MKKKNTPKLPNINRYKTQEKFEEALCKYMDEVKKQEKNYENKRKH